VVSGDGDDDDEDEDDGEEAPSVGQAHKRPRPNAYGGLLGGEQAAYARHGAAFGGLGAHPADQGGLHGFNPHAAYGGPYGGPYARAGPWDQGLAGLPGMVPSCSPFPFPGLSSFPPGFERGHPSGLGGGGATAVRAPYGQSGGGPGSAAPSRAPSPALEEQANKNKTKGKSARKKRRTATCMVGTYEVTCDGTYGNQSALNKHVRLVAMPNKTVLHKGVVKLSTSQRTVEIRWKVNAEGEA